MKSWRLKDEGDIILKCCPANNNLPHALLNFEFDENFGGICSEIILLLIRKRWALLRWTSWSNRRFKWHIHNFIETNQLLECYKAKATSDNIKLSYALVNHLQLLTLEAGACNNKIGCFFWTLPGWFVSYLLKKSLNRHFLRGVSEARLPQQCC